MYENEVWVAWQNSVKFNRVLKNIFLLDSQVIDLFWMWNVFIHYLWHFEYFLPYADLQTHTHMHTQYHFLNNFNWFSVSLSSCVSVLPHHNFHHLFSIILWYSFRSSFSITQSKGSLIRWAAPSCAGLPLFLPCLLYFHCGTLRLWRDISIKILYTHTVTSTRMAKGRFVLVQKSFK